MAVYNEILVGRFNRFLQKHFGMKGSPPAPQLGGELNPTISFLSGVENRYLESWERFGNGVVQPAVAAQTFAFRFRNPPNSGVVAVLEALAASNLSGNDTMQLTNSIVVPQTDLGTLDSGAQLDNRTRPNSSLIVSHGTGVPPITLTSQRAIAVRQAGPTVMADFILFEDQEITILPGMTYQIQDTAANLNQIGICTYIWRERFLEVSEAT
jgi:hypothetical protein